VLADGTQMNDYYAFGSPMGARTYARSGFGNYRFGFNGREKDNEVKGNGAQYDYGFRIYDPRIGKFLSVDPLFKTFPMLTPYQFASNTPLSAIDLDGLEAKLAIYGAGVHRDDAGKITSRDEPQFKKEANKDVQQKNATVALGIHKGNDLVETLKNYTKSEGSIEYLSISSHAGPMGIILDNGQYGLEVVGHPQTSRWTNSLGQKYTSTDIDKIAKNADIKFAANALVVFAGCNGGRTVAFTDNKTPIYSVAQDFTEKSGVASIGAYGFTAPIGKNGTRKADYEYRLFYKDENGTMQQMSLGKELNQEAIDKAKGVVNDVAKKIEEKNAKPTETPTEH
jgi:RHS repeat-associated protein